MPTKHSHSPPTHPTTKRCVWPLKVLLGVLMAVAAISGGLSGFLPPYFAGLASTRSITDKARVATLGAVTERVQSTFGAGPRLLDAWDGMRRSGVLHDNFTRFEEDPTRLAYPRVQALLLAFARLFVLDRDGAVPVLGLWSQGADQYAYVSRFGMYETFNRTHTTTASYDATTTTAINSAASPITVPGGYSAFMSFETNALLNRTAAPLAPQYLRGVFAGFASVEMLCGAVYTDSSSSSGKTVFTQAVITAASLAAVLEQLRLSEHHRLAILDAGTGAVLAVSWGEPPEQRLPDYNNFSLPPTSRMLPRTLEQMQDASVAAAVRSLGGSAAMLRLEPRPVVTTFYPDDDGTSLTREESKALVDLASITDSRYQLDLVAFSMIPERDLIGDVHQARTVAVAVVCGAVLAVVLLGVVLGWRVVRPLDVLAGQMFDTARFRDLKDASDTSDSKNTSHREGGHAPPPPGGEDPANATTGTPPSKPPPRPPSLSRLAEVAALQQAFADMRTQLYRVQSYLPQTLQLILMQNSSEGEIDNENLEDDPDEKKSHPGVSHDEGDLSKSDVSKNSSSASRRLGWSVGARSTGSHHRGDDDDHSNRSSATTTTTTTAFAESHNAKMTMHKRAAAEVAVSRAVGRSASNRVVSLLAVNVHGWHNSIYKGGADRHDHMLCQYIASVQAAVRAQRGVIESCHGDRMLASFNAVTTVASHATKAVWAALTLHEATTAQDVDEEQHYEMGSTPSNHPCNKKRGDTTQAHKNTVLSLSMGVSSGPALVGNMGTQGLMRFMIVGPCVGGAWELERGARLLTAAPDLRCLPLSESPPNDVLHVLGHAGTVRAMARGAYHSGARSVAVPPIAVFGSAPYAHNELAQTFWIVHADLALTKRPPASASTCKMAVLSLVVGPIQLHVADQVESMDQLCGNPSEQTTTAENVPLTSLLAFQQERAVDRHPKCRKASLAFKSASPPTTRADGEWMYALLSQASKDPFRATNTIFEDCVRDDGSAAAKALMTDYPFITTHNRVAPEAEEEEETNPPQQATARQGPHVLHWMGGGDPPPQCKAAHPDGDIPLPPEPLCALILRLRQQQKYRLHRMAQALCDVIASADAGSFERSTTPQSLLLRNMGLDLRDDANIELRH